MRVIQNWRAFKWALILGGISALILFMSRPKRLHFRSTRQKREDT